MTKYTAEQKQAIINQHVVPIIETLSRLSEDAGINLHIAATYDAGGAVVGIGGLMGNPESGAFRLPKLLSDVASLPAEDIQSLEGVVAKVAAVRRVEQAEKEGRAPDAEDMAIIAKAAVEMTAKKMARAGVGPEVADLLAKMAAGKAGCECPKCKG